MEWGYESATRPVPLWLRLLLLALLLVVVPVIVGIVEGWGR